MNGLRQANASAHQYRAVMLVKHAPKNIKARAANESEWLVLWQAGM